MCFCPIFYCKYKVLGANDINIVDVHRYTEVKRQIII